MEWLYKLTFTASIAHDIFILSAIVALGVAAGHLRIFGISLGIAGALFSGLLFGHLGLHIHLETLEFAREFGLVLFVYTVGVQIGPAFFASFRKQGLKLNLLAAGVVLTGAAVTAGLFFATNTPIGALVGVMSGAVTNTPGLAAAQEALKTTPAQAQHMIELSGMGYAVAYPFGILGIILTMLLTRWAFRVNLASEEERYAKEKAAFAPIHASYDLIVTNPRIEGKTIEKLMTLIDIPFIVSRLTRDGQETVPQPDTQLRLGDVIRVVCRTNDASGEQLPMDLGMLIGDLTEIDPNALSSRLIVRELAVTRKTGVNRSPAALDLSQRFHVNITRVQRAGIELLAAPSIRLQFGDRLTIVGSKESLDNVAKEIGADTARLEHPDILPIFIGVFLGVLLGSVPIQIPFVPSPVKLGIAGGPLLVALLLGRIGQIGPLSWYLPRSANLALREIGITLFLGCVGLKSGERFWATLTGGEGLYWMAMGVVITLIPLVFCAIVARGFFKLNYLSLCGLLSGCMTDPPALSFANKITRSDAPALTYASVYALTMFLRVFIAQLLVLFLV